MATTTQLLIHLNFYGRGYLFLRKVTYFSSKKTFEKVLQGGKVKRIA